MSTHDLCFEANIRKIGIALKPPFLLYKMGFKGVYISRTSLPDVAHSQIIILSKYRLLL